MLKLYAKRVEIINKKVQIRIYPNGSVESKTLNIKGKNCEKYIEILEKLTEAKTVNSEFTSEYYEIESVNSEYTTSNVEESYNA